MMHNEKKLANIIEELTIFFFSIGATEIKSGVRIQEGIGCIEMEADYLPEYEKKIASLEKYLNEPKNEGLEDFYWELAGAGDPGETSQLLLVGMMIDRAEIKVAENRVNLKLFKQLDF